MHGYSYGCQYGQGGLCPRLLNRIAQQVLLWTKDKFLSPRVIYTSGHLNVGADFVTV